jgi:hypothetical protein
MAAPVALEPELLAPRALKMHVAAAAGDGDHDGD